MQDCKPVATPIDPNQSLIKLKDDEQSVNLQDYQAVIGCLTYAMTISRPDLATSVGILSIFMSKPGQNHWKAVKRVLRYIKGSLNVGLKFDASCQTSVDDSVLRMLIGQEMLLKGNLPQDMFFKFAVVQSVGAVNVRK
eukprot:gene5487-biopygen473